MEKKVYGRIVTFRDSVGREGQLGGGHCRKRQPLSKTERFETYRRKDKRETV